MLNAAIGGRPRRTPGTIAPSEWRWLLVASSVVLLLGSVPTIYAWSPQRGTYLTPIDPKGRMQSMPSSTPRSEP